VLSPGHGAHTLEGPGRFVIFSGERSSGPFVSVYPDSDKVSVCPGIEPGGLNALRLVRAGSVDYWHGEGNGPVAPASVTREPKAVPRPLTINIGDLTFEPGDGWRWAPLGDPGGRTPPRRSGARARSRGGLWPLPLRARARAGAPRARWHAHRAARRGRAVAVIRRSRLPAGRSSRSAQTIQLQQRTARVLLLWTTGFPAAICTPRRANGCWPEPAGLLSAAFAMDEQLQLSGAAYRALSMPFYMERLVIAASLPQAYAGRGQAAVRWSRGRRRRSERWRAGGM